MMSNQIETTSLEIINITNGGSGTVNIKSNFTVKDFVRLLFVQNWINRNEIVLNTLKIRTSDDLDYVIFSSAGCNPENKDTLLETLKEHDSKNVVLEYEVKKNVSVEDSCFRKPYFKGSCLYGCPNAKEIQEAEENNLENSESMYQLFDDL